MLMLIMHFESCEEAMSAHSFIGPTALIEYIQSLHVSENVENLVVV